MIIRTLALLGVVVGLPCLAAAMPIPPSTYIINNHPDQGRLLGILDNHLVLMGNQTSAHHGGIFYTDFAGTLPATWINAGEDLSGEPSASRNLVFFDQVDDHSVRFEILPAYFDVLTRHYGAPTSAGPMDPAAELGTVNMIISNDVYSSSLGCSAFESPSANAAVFAWVVVYTPEGGQGDQFNGYVWSQSWPRPQRLGDPKTQVERVRVSGSHVAWSALYEAGVWYAALGPTGIQNSVFLGNGYVLDVVDDYIVWAESSQAKEYIVTRVGFGNTRIPVGGSCGLVLSGKLAKINGGFWLLHRDQMCGDALQKQPGMMLFGTNVQNLTTKLIDNDVSFEFVANDSGRVAYYGTSSPGARVVDFVP